MGLAEPANTGLLFLPKSQDGLQIQSLAVFYQRLQVSQPAQLLISLDPCAWNIVKPNLKKEIKAVRMKFKPALEVRDCLCAGPSMCRKQLMKAVKAEVSEKVDEVESKRLHNLPQQGQMRQIVSAENASKWSQAVTCMSLPD